jgi:hypothetical protein
MTSTYIATVKAGSALDAQDIAKRLCRDDGYVPVTVRRVVLITEGAYSVELAVRKAA